MHYINMGFLFLKEFVIHFDYYITYTSYKDIVILLLVVFSAIFIIKYIKKQPSKEPVLEQIMFYRFDYIYERYYSIFFVISSAFIYIISLFYLRYLSIGKTLNLKEVGFTLKTFILETSLLVSFTLLILLLALFYLVFVLLFGILRSYMNQEFTKLHFYYLDKPLYNKIFDYMKTKLSIKGRIYDIIFSCYIDCKSYLALGYQVYGQVYDEKKPYRFPTREEQDLMNNTWLSKYIKPNYFIVLLCNLHYIILLSVLCYDIYFNDFVIQTTFNILPYLFIYQIYIMISNYLEGKSLDDICEITNDHFYQDIIYVGDDVVVINGIPQQLPFNFAEEFMKYKNHNFTYRYHYKNNSKP